MNGFQDLKLDSEVIGHLSRLGYRRPTALQREAVPVIARGTSALGVASAGSGKTLAYALGILARLELGNPSLQALVLRPTDDGALATAEALYRLLHPRGLTVGVVQPRTPSAVQVAVASPSAALAAVEHSAIKLEGLRTLVVDGASSMVELGAGEVLETLTAQIPRETQRILLTSELTREVEDWSDRHARRARRFAYLPSEIQPLSGVTVEFCAAPHHQWLPVLGHLLSGGAARSGSHIQLHCRFESEAQMLADQLTVRGLRVAAGAGEPGIQIDWRETGGIVPGAVSISWGVPPDLDSLRAYAQEAARAVVFAEPKEVAHLRRLTSALGVRLSALKSTLPAEALRSAQTTRDQLREALTHCDLEPYMHLLEPLLDEFTPTQIAAAATVLLRERTPPPATPQLPAWTRLYFGVGRRDGVRPADLVGAITGEAPVGGDRIGRIEIRDTHSLVEVAASVADQVIKSLVTATIRGRPANVRLYRE